MGQNYSIIIQNVEKKDRGEIIMEEKNGKIKFSEKHPVIGLLLCTYGSFLIAQFGIGLLLYFPVSVVTGLDINTSVIIGAIIGSLIVLAFWYKRWKPEYHILPEKRNVADAFRLMSPILLYWIFLFGAYAIFLTDGKVTFTALGIADIVACTMAGLSEEIIYREISISYMTKRWTEEKMIPIIAGISALLFGLTHLSNTLGSGEIVDSIYQAALTICFGYFFAAVYLRTGFVWVPVLFHMAHDMLVFSNLYGLDKYGITELPNWISVVIFVFEAALGVYGFFLLRKSKREEIVNLWNHKWSRLN